MDVYGVVHLDRLPPSRSSCAPTSRLAPLMFQDRPKALESHLDDLQASMETVINDIADYVPALTDARTLRKYIPDVGHHKHVLGGRVLQGVKSCVEGCGGDPKRHAAVVAKPALGAGLLNQPAMADDALDSAVADHLVLGGIHGPVRRF